MIQMCVCLSCGEATFERKVICYYSVYSQMFQAQIGEFDWDSQMQGFILGGFALGNVFTVFMGGLLSEKFGGKLMFSVGIFLSCLCSLLLPFAAQVSPIFVVFIRAVQGASQGPLIPAFHNMANKWYPKQAKNMLMTLTICGMYLLTAPGPL